jgi:hypothetical protein
VLIAAALARNLSRCRSLDVGLISPLCLGLFGFLLLDSAPVQERKQSGERRPGVEVGKASL